MPQVDWLTDFDGKIAVEYVARYERLDEHFAGICKRLNRTAALPHLKRTARKPYQAHYDNESIEIIRERFKKDVGAFGYAPPELRIDR